MCRSCEVLAVVDGYKKSVEKTMHSFAVKSLTFVRLGSVLSGKEGVRFPMKIAKMSVMEGNYEY